MNYLVLFGQSETQRYPVIDRGSSNIWESNCCQWIYCLSTSCFLITNWFLFKAVRSVWRGVGRTHTHTHTPTLAVCDWCVCVCVGRPCVAFRVALQLWELLWAEDEEDVCCSLTAAGFFLGDHFWHFVDFMESVWADTSATWTRTRTRTCCCFLSFVWLICCCLNRAW